MKDSDAEKGIVEKKEPTPEEQDRLARAQVICDKLVTRMQAEMETDARHCLDSSTVVESMAGDDFSAAWDIQTAMELTENYFRFYELPTSFHYEYSRSSEKDEQSVHTYSLTVGHNPKKDN